MEVALIDRSVNPLEEGFDVALGGMPASYDGVLNEPLCQLAQVVCASPEYLEQRGTPKHPRDLADHECLVFRPPGRRGCLTHRGPINVDVPTKLAANDTSMLFAATCAETALRFFLLTSRRQRSVRGNWYRYFPSSRFRRFGSRRSCQSVRQALGELTRCSRG